MQSNSTRFRGPGPVFSGKCIWLRRQSSSSSSQGIGATKGQSEK